MYQKLHTHTPYSTTMSNGLCRVFYKFFYKPHNDGNNSHFMNGEVKT